MFYSMYTLDFELIVNFFFYHFYVLKNFNPTTRSVTEATNIVYTKLTRCYSHCGCLWGKIIETS